MSLGLGLVISVLLLIVAWQLEKRHAWRKAAAVAAGVLILGLLAVLTVVQLSDWSRAREVQAEVERVRKGEFREYQGISLGATKKEILYRKGKPTEESASAWVYRDSNTVQVIWTNSATVAAVVCDGPWFGCDEVAGAGIGTSEKALRELLGQPQREAGPDDKGQKVIDYGNDEFRVTFILNQTGVTEILVRGSQIKLEGDPGY